MLPVEDWESVGTGQHPATAKRSHHYIRVLCSIVKKKDIDIGKQKEENDKGNSDVTWSGLVGGNMKVVESRLVRVSVTTVVNEIKGILKNVVVSGIGYEGENADKKRVDEVLKVLKLDRDSVKSQRQITRKKNGSDKREKALD